MGVDYRDSVIAFVKNRGPSLPLQIAKHMNTNSLMASAMLSELVSKQSLKISALKVGSSPLYYAPGDEEKLLQFVNNLNEKDRNTVELLKQKQVLRDTDQEPLIRVSLRQIKDFAVQLDVTAGEKSEIFWKWYLLPDDQAISTIKRQLGIHEKQEKLKVPEKKVEKTTEKSAEGAKSAIEKEPERQEKAVKKKQASDDIFSGAVENYFKSKGIIFGNQVVIRKGEIDYLTKVPTPVGEVAFFCKARNKDKITDADISSALVQGQLKHLPVMLLITGQTTKKAEELLSSLSGITVAKLNGS